MPATVLIAVLAVGGTQKIDTPMGFVGLAEPVAVIGSIMHLRPFESVQLPAATPITPTAQSAFVEQEMNPPPFARRRASQYLSSGPKLHWPSPPPIGLQMPSVSHWFGSGSPEPLGPHVP